MLARYHHQDYYFFGGDPHLFRIPNDTVDGSEIRLTTWDGAKTL